MVTGHDDMVNDFKQHSVLYAIHFICLILGDYEALARTPVDVYRGLVQTQLDDKIAEQIDSVVSRFTDFVF
ncbi:unnamed protein product, partial [marine sediment metagenome]